MGSGGKKSRRKVRSRIEQFELDDAGGLPEAPDNGQDYVPAPEDRKTTQARTMAEILREEHKAKAKRKAAEEAQRAPPP